MKIRYFIPKNTETFVRLHGGNGKFVMSSPVMTEKDVYMGIEDRIPAYVFSELHGKYYLVFKVPYDPEFLVEYMAVRNEYVAMQEVKE